MSHTKNEVNLCEVCGNRNVVEVLDLGLQPMCDDLVAIGDDRVCREYPTVILFCDQCRTAHQRFPIPKDELFPSSYHYRSRFTADVLEGMTGLVKSCEEKLGDLEGKLVVDIGCNDGSLLDRFRDRGARTVGIEPTNAWREARDKGHLVFEAFLDFEAVDKIVAAAGKPDIVTFTNVFAHIEDLPAVISALKRLSSPNTVTVIENHYLGSVLDQSQFDTFYHEHARTYSYSSFRYVAKSLGVGIRDVEFPSRYGGNIRVFLGATTGGADEDPSGLRALDAREARFLSDFVRLGEDMSSWRAATKRLLLDKARAYGPLKAKAFPGRAAILMNLLDVDERVIGAVYEKPGSLKVGHYVPGTRIPILSDDRLVEELDATPLLINLAWHIPREIRSYLDGLGYKGEVVDILGPEHFGGSS